MDEPFVSIIMRSYNEGWALRDTLRALAAQDYTNRELIVIDSGSTDGSVDLIRAAVPRHFVRIEPHEYHPPRVLNHGMRLARSDYCIFLNADATPQGYNWLRTLVRPLLDPSVAAVYGRQNPRPGCKAVFACDYERCFGPRRESSRWDHFFSMVSSGIRRDIWSLRGFNESMRYSEDDEYTRWCRSQGYRVLYVPDAWVLHSHNYTVEQVKRRFQGEGRALAAVYDGDPGSQNFLRGVLMGWGRDALRDLGFCVRHRRIHEWPHSLRIRWHQRCARVRGFREGWEEYRGGGHTGHALPPVWARQGV